MSAPTLITLWFPDKTRGVMLGLRCCWVPLSITLDALVTPSIAAFFGWQGVFWFVIIFAAVALFINPKPKNKPLSDEEENHK